VQEGTNRNSLVDLKVNSILAMEPNVRQVMPPVTVCGDIHGQFYDLLELFSLNGDPKENQYLFLVGSSPLNNDKIGGLCRSRFIQFGDAYSLVFI
jgi:hypothetical protein